MFSKRKTFFGWRRNSIRSVSGKERRIVWFKFWTQTLSFRSFFFESQFSAKMIVGKRRLGKIEIKWRRIKKHSIQIRRKIWIEKKTLLTKKIYRHVYEKIFGIGTFEVLCSEILLEIEIFVKLSKLYMVS